MDAITMLERQLRAALVIPVVTLDHVDDAVPLAHTLYEAGVTLLEVALRSSVALDAIRAVRQAEIPITIAAGTIRTSTDLHAASAAGATLLVSPGSTPALIAAVRSAQLIWLPGASTPSEVMALADAGHVIQKLFPASLALLDALAGPFPDIRFVPTGGVDSNNLRDFLTRPNVIAVAGSWIAPRELIRAHAWPEIHDRAVAALAVATRI